MKKITIVCAVILALVFTGCSFVGKATVIDKTPVSDDVVGMDTEITLNTIPEVSVENMSVVEHKKEDYPFYRVVDVETFVEYLYNKMPSCKFRVEQYSENYFDDYFGMNISEYGCIVGTFDETFDMLMFNVSFVDNKIVDFSMTVNLPDTVFFDEYKEFVNTVFVDLGVTYGMNESELVEFENVYLDFDSYKPNVYGNPENSAYINNVTALSVIFEGGKDIELNGVSYYFVASTIM